LLLADLITVTSWRGIEEGGKDYERACDLLEEGPGTEGCAIAIGGETGVVWEMEGGGTAGVFRRGQDYAIVTRIWPEDPDDTRTFRVLAEVAAADIARIAELSIASGVLAILWAPEDGVLSNLSIRRGCRWERCRWGAPGSPWNSRRASTTASTMP